jgi:hypothetical protein
VLSYQHDESGFDPESLVRALQAAHGGQAVTATSVEQRRHQRRVIGFAHDRLYAELVGVDLSRASA